MQQFIVSGCSRANYEIDFDAFVSEAGGQRFKSRAGQIGHSVANGSPTLRHFCAMQTRRQDSVIGRAEINFGGHEKFIYVNSRGARKVYWSMDQTKKVKTKKKVFSTKISTNSGCRLKIPAIFHKFLSEDQKKKKKVFVPKL